MEWRRHHLLLLALIVPVTVLAAVGADRLTGLDAAEAESLRLRADLGQPAAWLRLQAAARLGNVEAMRAEGLRLLGHGEPGATASAVEHLAAAAERGDTGSALILGRLYFFGKPGLPRDYRRAQAWLERAAPAQPVADYYLALIASNGLAGGADPARAEAALQRAAAGGVSQAMFLLASSYLNGDGRPGAAAEVLRLMRHAAELEHPGALQFLAQAYERGELGLARDEREAALLFTLAGEAARDSSAYP